MFLKIFLLFLAIEFSRTDDLCNSRAVLTLIDTFEMRKQISSEGVFDLSLYNKLFGEIVKYKPIFKNMLSNLTDPDILRKSEPDPLMPFNNDFNLIKITGEINKFPALCKAKAGKMIRLENISQKKQLLEIMAANDIESTPLYLEINKNMLFFADGTFYSTTNDAAALNIKTGDFPILLRDGNLRFPSSTSVSTETTTGLCVKNSQPFDSKDKNLNIWVSLANQILHKLSLLPKLEKGFNSVFKDIKQKMETRPNNSYELKPPIFLNKVAKFLQKFSNPSYWIELSQNGIFEFTDFVQNLQSLIDFFQKIKINDNKINLPLYDLNALVNFLNMGPDLGVFGQNAIFFPLSTYSTDENSGPELVRSKIIFDAVSPGTNIVRIYNVKPFFTATKTLPRAHFIIKTNRSFFSTYSEVLPIGCKILNGVRTCEGLKLTKLTTQNPIPMKCTLALLDEGSDIESCPVEQTNLSFVSYKASCNSANTIVLSSIQPVSVNVICNGVFKKLLKLTRFPAYVTTNCELQDATSREMVFPQFQLNADISNFNFTEPAPETIATEAKPEWYGPVVYGTPVGIGMIILSVTIYCLILYCRNPTKCLASCNLACCGMIRLYTCCKNCCCNCCKTPAETLDPELAKQLQLLQRQLPNAPIYELEPLNKNRSGTQSVISGVQEKRATKSMTNLDQNSMHHSFR